MSRLNKRLEVLGRRLMALMPGLWTDTPALFVLSTGRTGTETLARLLDLHHSIDAYHEPHPQLLVERKQARLEVYVQPEKYRRIFSESRSTPIWKSGRRGKLYAETSARLTFFAPIISQLMPNAKFVYMHRHPGDVVRSGMRRGWYVDHPADYARIEPGPQEEAYHCWRSWGAFEKICWYWDAYNRFALDFLDSMSADRVFIMPCQMLYQGTDIGLLFDFIGLDKPDDEKIGEILSHRYNSQLESEFPKFGDWDSEMKQTLYMIAGDTMRRLGYPLV